MTTNKLVLQRLLCAIVVASAVSASSSVALAVLPRVPDVPRAPSYAQAHETPRSREFFGIFQRRFNPNRPVEIFPYVKPILIAIVIVGVAIVGIVVYNKLVLRYTMRNGYDSPKRLFNDLCILHELIRSERQFLKQFAETIRLPDPLMLFVDPKFLLDATHNSGFARNHVMIEGLLIKVFGGTDEESMPSGVTSGTQWGQSGAGDSRRGTNSGQWGDTVSMAGQSGAWSSAGSIAAEESQSSQQGSQQSSQQSSSEKNTPQKSASDSAVSFLTRLVRSVKCCLYNWDDFWYVVNRFVSECVCALVRPTPKSLPTQKRPNIVFSAVKSRISIAELER